MLGSWKAALAIVFVLTFVAGRSARAQTYQVLHTFTAGADGAQPQAGVTIDKAGNLYGTTAYYGAGTVYKLTNGRSGWTFSTLFSFNNADGAHPVARVVFGPNGSLYGTTGTGGAYNWGTVFNLQPPLGVCKSISCPWRQTILYNFKGGSDAADPFYGDLTFDPMGNIYGTTFYGGDNGVGAVYELARHSDGSYVESVIHSFGSGFDGAYPTAGLVFDAYSNLWGTTVNGGLNGVGTVFELTYQQQVGWGESGLFWFTGGLIGSYPFASLVYDPSSDYFYGITAKSGAYNGGTIFQLIPIEGITVITLQSFDGCTTISYGPVRPLVMDASGTIYGTNECDGAYHYGTVFKFQLVGGVWTYTDLYDFTGGSDGGYPVSNVVFDANGNLYGTASQGGNLSDCGGSGCGVVWKVTP